MPGCGISKRLRGISRGGLEVNQGSLYPALHRMEDRGFISAESDISDEGRRAKVYQLTKVGREQFAEEQERWTLFFVAGGLFSHVIAFQALWAVFASLETELVTFTPRIAPMFSLYMRMLLAFGAVFQMSILAFFLVRMGLITPDCSFATSNTPSSSFLSWPPPRPHPLTPSTNSSWRARCRHSTG